MCIPLLLWKVQNIVPSVFENNLQIARDHSLDVFEAWSKSMVLSILKFEGMNSSRKDTFGFRLLFLCEVYMCLRSWVPPEAQDRGWVAKYTHSLVSISDKYFVLPARTSVTTSNLLTYWSANFSSLSPLYPSSFRRNTLLVSPFNLDILM